MYSSSQREAIMKFFDTYRTISVYDVVSSLYGVSRKPYYKARDGRADPEETIRMAMLAKIEPDKIINELFKLTNFSLDDPNVRNQIILDGITKQLPICEINKQLINAREYPL